MSLSLPGFRARRTESASRLALLRQVHAWLLILPAVGLLAAFTHYPTIASLVASFFSTPRRNRPAEWVGLHNYRVMVDDPIFWQVMGNNVVFALGIIPTSMALALGMALWVNGKLRGRAFVRLCYFVPTMLPMIAVANIWLFIYAPGLGLLDQLRRSLFGLGETNWLGSPDTVLGALIVMAIWKEAGFFMIFFLAALQAIPPELEEAARLEGAGRFHYFRRVLFPLLMPTTLFVLINAIITAFRTVDHLFVMTMGGPSNASSLLLFYIYENAFVWRDIGYAAALTMVMLCILFVVAIIQFFVLDRRTHYQ
jgi:sn-glycerol 3-phosphate transport system permease protein